MDRKLDKVTYLLYLRHSYGGNIIERNGTEDSWLVYVLVGHMEFILHVNFDNLITTMLLSMWFTVHRSQQLYGAFSSKIPQPPYQYTVVLLSL